MENRPPKRGNTTGEWSDPDKRIQLAPGEEILSEVFQHFGSRYRKPADTVRVAREMGIDEVPAEVQEVLSSVVALVSRD